MRWRIERDYQELKQELGFADYEGCGWRGFQDHATLCIAAYGFLIAEGGAFPPSGPAPTALFTGSALPVDFRPRGAPNPARTARAELDRQYPSAPHRRSCQDAPQMRCCNSPIQNLRKIPVTDAVRLVHCGLRLR